MPNSSPHAERVYFHPVNESSAQINVLLELVTERLLQLVANCRIEHIGSTAIPDSLSKGDLDILVIVTDSKFDEAQQIFKQQFAPNIGTPADNGFASFECHDYAASVGIQLMSDTANYPPFLQWRELLLANSKVKQEYDDLKRQFEGKLMSDYRDAKEKLICKYFPDPDEL